MASESTTTPEVPDGFTDPMTLEELVKHWAALRLAHEAVMVDKLPKINKYQFDSAEFARTGKWPESTASAGGDDMGVSIGNREIHNHYHNETSQAAQANSTTTEASPVAKVTSTLAKAAAAAALVGAGGIGVVGVNMAIDALKQPETVVVQPTVDTDTNAGLRFKE